MNNSYYAQAIKQIAKGYIFIFLNINIGTLNIIPNWIGYIMFYRAIPSIAKYEKSAKLLNPLIIFIGSYELLCWFFQIFNINLDIYIIEVIISALKLYLDFQLLTNIADIAISHQYEDSQKIYTLRNIQVVLMTLIVLPIQWEKFVFGTVVYILLCVVITIWICVVLFDYARFEEKKSVIDFISEE